MFGAAAQTVLPVQDFKSNGATASLFNNQFVYFKILLSCLFSSLTHTVFSSRLGIKRTYCFLLFSNALL